VIRYAVHVMLIATGEIEGAVIDDGTRTWRRNLAVQLRNVGRPECSRT
jgi:hypothetical protein